MAEEISTYGSTVTIDEKVNNSAQYAAEFTFKQVFNKVNRTRQEALANESGAEVTYPAGLVMGRVNATGKIQEFVMRNQY